MDIQSLDSKAKQIRATVIKMAFNAKISHLTGTLSCVDILIGLFHSCLRIFPKDFKNEKRDRFIFSKGHGCSALYAVMADIGFFPISWLERYAESEFSLPSHPCVHMLPQLEFSSGSLGHGLGAATGIAYGIKMKELDSKSFVLMSDGECNEGSVWEAAMFAAARKLDNVVAIIDHNQIQAVGRTKEIMGDTSLAEKFKAFGWNVSNINGNDMKDVIKALKQIKYGTGKPSVIVANTTAGAGISFMEDKLLWYYRTPSKEDCEMALKELGVMPLIEN